MTNNFISRALVSFKPILDKNLYESFAINKSKMGFTSERKGHMRKKRTKGKNKPAATTYIGFATIISNSL